MNAETFTDATETQRLQRGIDNLVSVLSLPAIWTGGEASLVLTTLLESLVRMLRLDFAYVRLSDLPEDSANEWARFGDGADRGLTAREVGEGLQPFLKERVDTVGLDVGSSLGEGRLVVIQLGHTERLGQFAACSRRSDFPDDIERLVLQVATNQAAIALQEARHVSQLQRAAAETEDRLKQMADQVSEVIWINTLEPEERVVYTSPSFERVWGRSLDDLYRNPRLWTETIHPEDRQRVADTYSRWIEGADVSYQDVEFRIVQPSGAVRWIHERGVLTVNEKGRPVRVSGISTDITERKRAEQRLVAQHTVTQVLAEAATLEEATPKILQAVCESLVWDLGELWRIDRAAGVLRRVESWRKASVEVSAFEAITRESTFLPGIGLPGRVWASHEPAYIPDVVHDANFVRAPIAAREGLHAAFAFPILLGSEVIGVMDFFSQEIRQPDQDLLEMMATIGSQIGQFIERKRAEKELRRNDFYLAEGQRIAHLGSWAFDPAGFFDHWSEELFQIYGLDPAGAAPTLDEYLALVHPQDREFMARLIERMLAEASGCDVKKRIVRPDGEVRYIRCVGVPVVENGVLKRIVGTAMDVTEQEHLTQELRRREAYLTEAQRLSSTGSFGWRPSSGEILWSEEMYRIFDVDRATKPTVELVLKVTHPEDRDRVRELIEHTAREARDWDIQHRLLMADGTVKHLSIVVHVANDETGGPTEYVGAVMDVTAATESRQALEKAYGEITRLKEQLQKENIVLREEIDKTSMFEEIVGSSPALRRVLAQVEKVAPTDSTVLITGETGTGKELVARAIHKHSKRSARALVSVNCAAIPPSLIASELFGHEKGAFTGAMQRRQGRFELADGGTIFLDEVGELPPEIQITLLRVLQEREFERVGGSRPIRTDVRVIAASNRDLEAAVAENAFRADLFYRLNVFPLEMPALRDRRADIPVLVEYFIHRYARRAGKRIHGISKSSLDLLKSYDWPGNVRELQNVVERAVIVSDSETLSIDERWLLARSAAPREAASRHFPTLASRERDAIEGALAQTKGRVAGPFGAAERLGVPSSTLESKIRSMKIDKRRYKRPQPDQPG